VAELGGGTGVLTQALLQRGIVPERLTVIECSPVFVRHLRAQFPRVTILLGDAAELGELLPRGSHIDAIVSSLPLRSLPAREAEAIVAQWSALVADGSLVVQYTYDLLIGFVVEVEAIPLTYLGRGRDRFGCTAWSRPARNSTTAFVTARATLRASSCTGPSRSSAS
jgi:phospholipid N-methyltransferase